MKCLFVVAVALLVVCVSADDDKKELCFKEKSDAQKEECKKHWTECKDAHADEKDKKTKMMKCFKCYLQKKNLVNDKDEIDVDALNTKIAEHQATKEFGDAVIKVVTDCGNEDKAFDKFMGCFMKKKDGLPCKCHKKCKKGDEEAAAGADDVTG